MKVLVIGSGGREHAVIRKLKENKEIDTIWCAPGNGGISADAVCVDIKAMDKEGLVSFNESVHGHSIEQSFLFGIRNGPEGPSVTLVYK